jgi:hypothetical protein
MQVVHRAAQTGGCRAPARAEETHTERMPVLITVASPLDFVQIIWGILKRAAQSPPVSLRDVSDIGRWIDWRIGWIGYLISWWRRDAAMIQMLPTTLRTVIF